MNVLKDGEIWLHGTVGSGFFMDGFSAADVQSALSSIGRTKPVTVHINSGGGIASEGAAIHAVLSAHRGRKTVLIEGVAASAASAIAMAGDEVIMTKGSIMMIHDPSGITLGTSEDHAKSIEMLEAVAESMADIYATKSGRSREEAREDMKEEIWLKPEDALEMGYCDRIETRGKAAPIAAFDYRVYGNAPEKFVAMASAKGWELDGDGAAGAANQERKMDKTKNGGTADAKGGVDIESDEFKAAVASAVTAALAKKEADDKATADQAAADAAKKGGTETTEQITARVRQEEQKRTADITAACALANQSEKAAKFIADGTSLSDVVAALQTARVEATNKGGTAGTTANRTTELNNHRGAGSDGKGDVDPSAAWKKQTDKINARNHRHVGGRA